jgi:hypothetical protein
MKHTLEQMRIVTAASATIRPCAGRVKTVGIPATWIVLAFFCCTAKSRAAITVQLHGGTDNLPTTALGITLKNVAGLDPGYASVLNDSHTISGGVSDYEFARYVPDGGGTCIYWFGASDLPTDYFDSHAEVYWLGYGDSTLVDGAKWGSDNYVHVVSSETSIGILQFNFDEATEPASLVASALDTGGITFADGVAAIQAASVPEPSPVLLLVAGVFGMSALQRKR